MTKKQKEIRKYTLSYFRNRQKYDKNKKKLENTSYLISEIDKSMTKRSPNKQQNIMGEN